MLRGLQSDGNIQHPVDPVYRNNTVTPVYQVEETASDVSISGKIFIGMGFISFLMFILGGFHWYFNRKYSRETEAAIAEYIVARNEAQAALQQGNEDAETIKRRIRLIREVGKRKMNVKERDILTEAQVIALSNKSSAPDSEVSENGATSTSIKPASERSLSSGVLNPFFDDTTGYGSDIDQAIDTYIKLPDKRIVRNSCSICLTSYCKGDSLVWSSNTLCPHVYHFECIMRWLCLRDESQCPMCRREYVKINAEKRQGLDRSNSEDMWSFHFGNESNGGVRRRVSFVTDDTSVADDLSRTVNATHSLRSELAAYIIDRYSSPPTIGELTSVSSPDHRLHRRLSAPPFTSILDQMERSLESSSSKLTRSTSAPELCSRITESCNPR